MMHTMGQATLNILLVTHLPLFPQPTDPLEVDNWLLTNESMSEA
jgi:hypothetical protein